MTSAVVLILLVLVLFSIVFFTKRRYGVLALALVAGSMLSILWVSDLTPIVAQAGFVLFKPPLESVVACLLVLLPAIILLTNGPVYHTAAQRALGASLFAVLAVVLLLDPIGSALIIDGVGKGVYDFLVANRIVITTICIVVALFDIIFTKTPKNPSKH